MNTHRLLEGRTAREANGNPDLVARHQSAWQRILVRYALFGVVWLGVFILSWFTFQKGRWLGGTASWAGLLHPVAFGLTAWPVVRRFTRGERWFTIPNAVLGLSYLAIALGSVYFVFYYDSLGYRALRRPEDVRAALMVALAGILAYRIGAEGPWFGRWIKRLPRMPSAPPWSWGVRVGVLLVIGVSVIAKIFLAATGSFGYLTGEGAFTNTGLWSIVNYLAQTGLLALSGAYFYWFSGAPLSRGDQVYLVSATGILTVLALVSGMKEEFLLVLFSVVIPYTWCKRSRQAVASSRGKELVVASSLLAVVLLVFAINPLYRSALNQLGATQNRFEQSPVAAQLVVEELASGAGVADLFATGVENAWGRLSIFPYLLAVVDQVPESHPYRGFERYPLLPVMTLVPRIVWPEKPAMNSGSNFQRTFISSDVVYPTTPTVYGWSYLEGGVFGGVVLLLVLGLIAGFVEEYLVEHQPRAVAAVILYTACFVALAWIEADPFWQLSGIPKLVVVALFAYGLFVMPRWLSRR